MNILHVVGARPNFIKLAPVHRAFQGKSSINQVIVHTGQHYDANMSDVFFKELELPLPDINLQVGSGTHAEQTAAIMTRFEPVVLKSRPDLVLVYGDVNSTLAAGLVCAKLQIEVGHVEAGLRSFDRSMPEEINRIVTDRLADLLFTPSTDGDENLLREGAARDQIHFVGNVMVDTLVRFLPKVARRHPGAVERFNLSEFGLITLHRPSNVDDSDSLLSIVAVLNEVAQDFPLLFPIHPRTRQRLNLGKATGNGRIHFLHPLSYLDFLALQQKAKFVITDSGGIQEETTFLGIPCLTLRENTERPITVTLGTNILIGKDLHRLRSEIVKIRAGDAKKGQVPPLWDGKAGERIADIVSSGVWGSSKRSAVHTAIA